MIRHRLVVHGACGRMGQRVVEFVRQDPECELVGALEGPGHPRLGEDIGTVLGVGPLGVKVSDRLPEVADAAIDFSVPAASLALAKRCAARRLPLVVATTGFTAEQREELDAVAHETALLVSANFSLVVNVLMKLAAVAGEALRGKDFDVEIIERHHRHKHDSPSGTALQIAGAVKAAMALGPLRHGREGLVGERPRDEIGIHAVRAGDNVGEHTVIFSTLGETLELVHKGTSRDSYAKGAVAAAKRIAGFGPGHYAMSDVLGL